MIRTRTVSTAQPGWTRRRVGRGFTYLDADGQRLADDEIARVRALAIPPAWEQVWICPDDRGHLQAVGTDAAGRRQYLYHPAWRTRRDAEKFQRVQQLGRAMPRLRERVRSDLAGEGMVLDRACALAVRMIDLGYFRIGSDAYTDEHGSFGLTTLERRHVRRRNGALVFRFTGKSGVEHTISIDDPEAIEAIEALRRRRGGFGELLAFKDGARWRRLEAAAVNDYLREISALEVTAKDFRTWHATVLAAVALAETTEPGQSQASRKRAVAAAMRDVATYLGNTPAVARSSYVDPRVVEAYQEGRTITPSSRRAALEPAELQDATERAVLRLLRSA